MILNTIKYFFLVISIVTLHSCASEETMRQNQDEFGSTKRTAYEGTFGRKAYLGIFYEQSDRDSFTVYTTYRIRYDAFIFSREIDSARTTFSASGELSIEILDSASHSSVTRNIEKIHLSAEHNSSEYLEELYYQGVASFKLPHGMYIALMRIEDKSAAKRLPDIRERILLNTENNDATPSIVWLSTSFSNNRFHVLNLGKDISFSQPATALFAISQNLSDTLAHISLSKLNHQNEKPIIVFKDSTVSIRNIPASSFTLENISEGVGLALQPKAQSTIFFIDLHTEMLEQGTYKIDISLQDSVQCSTIFATQWLTMPRSLTNLDLSIEVLRYITTESEFSEIRSGNRNENIQHLKDFWKKKDPTPHTAFNEAMAEYYKRVDYSVEAFQSLNKGNGALTDRGKIYILNGPPSSIERFLLPNNVPREIWKYMNIKKIFFFEDQGKNGNYTLTAKQDL